MAKTTTYVIFLSNGNGIRVDRDNETSDLIKDITNSSVDPVRLEDVNGGIHHIFKAHIVDIVRPSDDVIKASDAARAAVATESAES